MKRRQVQSRNFKRSSDGAKVERPPIRRQRRSHLVKPVLLLLSGLIALVIIYNLLDQHFRVPLPRVITPFSSPKLLSIPMFKGDHQESLYWGTYRPHVYLGIRARTPMSLLAGLMWLGTKDGTISLRHHCQDSDGLSNYGWVSHNGRDFGRQIVIDNDVSLTTSFMKYKSQESGYGGDWVVRIDVQDDKEEGNENISESKHLFFYLAEEDSDANLQIDGSDLGDSSLLASGSRKDVGNWQMHLNSEDSLDLHYAGFKTTHFHNLSDLVQQHLVFQVRRRNNFALSNTVYEYSNVLVFQISGKIPFRVDLTFISGATVPEASERVNILSGASLSSRLKDKEAEFDAKFDKCFSVKDKVDPDSVLVGKASISNMLGGMGYFFGQSRVSSSKGAESIIDYWPAELYTAVPSRAFFPRGFLWDEGFHQLLIWRWDVNIALDAIGHWLDLMNIDGWIPREQILGSEARSKVPEEFVVQLPTNANPPTLFLVIQDILNGVHKNMFSPAEVDRITTFLDTSYVRLRRWFQWFNTSQIGKEPSTYFWHGRDSLTTRELNPKTLSSGFDDYPRASHPSDDERHLDLRCWMLLAATCMDSIGQLINKNDGYKATAVLLSDFDLLNKMHFNSANEAYFDYGNHTEKVKLRRNESSWELVREVQSKAEISHVPHFGYVNLFPFIMRIIPHDSGILGKQLDFISDKSVLWTDFGLRSLSRKSSLYMKRNTEHDPPYWRGPVWLNINYLVLSSLHHYSQVDGPHSKRAELVYKELRENLIRNVVKQYKESGFVWEHYNQKNGKGKGARPFTGWSALILLIMSENYI